MSIDIASLAIGFGIACTLQVALDRVLFKLFGRIITSAIGKQAVIKAFQDALLKFGQEKR